jgi:hypothetical protein
MKDLIQRYVGQTIGANVVKPHSVEPTIVIATEDDYFTVQVQGSDDLYHVPYLNIVKVIENSSGITIKEFFHRNHTYALVIKIGHLIEYVPT